MPYLFRDKNTSSVHVLERKPLVGAGDCVELVRRYAPMLATRSTPTWRPGKRVIDFGTGNAPVPGTVIATFYEGHYPSWPHGNHAAFFLRVTERDRSGRITEIMIVDQWKGDPHRNFVGSRRLWIKKPPERLANGKPCMSNDLSYFYVVE